jgi:chromosome segregation ATPase
MKKRYKITMASALVASLVGCSEQSTSSAPSAEITEQLTAFASTNQKLEKRLSELEKNNRMLEGDVNVLKDQLANQSKTDEDGNLNEQVAEIVNNELGELIAAKLDEQAGGEGLTQQLLATSWNQQMTAFKEKEEAAEEARREERRAEEEERREEQTAQRLAKMAEDLGIDDTQAGQLQVAMDTMRTQAREYFNEMREGGGGFDRDTIRDEMTKLRDVHLQVTSQFLTTEQQAAYSEMSDRGGFGGGPPGGFSGGGRGGRGGGR